MNGRIVVAGGTGFVGRPLVESLRRGGSEVVVLTRRPRSPGDVEWDGASLDGWARAVDGAGAVINLAGESVGGGRWTARRKERILRSRVDSTSVLVDAIAAARRPPRVLVTASGIDYPGDSGDEVVREDAAAGRSFLARVCVAWEAAAARVADHGVRWVALRTPLVVGRGATALRLLALPFRLFVGGRLGSGDQWFPWLHLDDMVALYERAIADESLSGPVHAVAPDLRRQRDVARELGRVLGRPAAVPAPAPLLRLALGEQADLLLHGQRAESAKLDGYAFRYPELGAALTEALR